MIPQIREYEVLQRRVAKFLVEVVRLSSYVTDGECPTPQELATSMKISVEQARQRLRRFRKGQYFVKQGETEVLNPHLCHRPSSAKFLLFVQQLLLEARSSFDVRDIVEKVTINGFDNAEEITNAALASGYLLVREDGTVRIGHLLRKHMFYLKELRLKRFS